MKILSHIHKLSPLDIKSWGLLLVLSIGTFIHADAQLVIGGNVYGGGDMGDVKGSTSVQVLSGLLGTDDLENPGGSVFGGARMANVGGSALVDIDGAHATDYILINRVYGGNDISGTIGSYAEAGETDKFPTSVLSDAAHDGVDATWNAFVHISDGGISRPIYIGQVYGGGNGDYDYDSDNSPFKGLNRPELGKTYLDLHGGSIVYAFGGGNAATVTQSTIICLDNPSTVVNSIKDSRINEQEHLISPSTDTGSEGELLTTARFKAMGINTGYSKPSSDEFQIGRLFGGNNKADMKIRPTWHLEDGLVRNLYSGGNQGRMTSPEGILVDINSGSTVVIDNLYGGCRMADVRPLQIDYKGDYVLDGNGQPLDMDIIQLNDPRYAFPAGLAARVVVDGGDVNNVYGGNDVTGQVYGGNAVGIRKSIRGNVYGGGNGSYPYTDNPLLKDNDIYSDLYYEIPDGMSSVEALNQIRPDAEQVSIHLYGTQDNPTIIGGSVYCGGNSATLETKTIQGAPKVELKIGSYVIAENVFMGNNGENMIDQDILSLFAGSVDPVSGEPSDAEGAIDFSSLELTDQATFSTYMEGAAMSYIPTVSFESTENGDNVDYIPYTTYFGSFYCGGNVGSMTYSGTNYMDMYAPVIVYNKIVGGCNNANIPYRAGLNAAYEGGVMGAANERPYLDDQENEVNPFTESNGAIKDRLILNFRGVRIEPKEWRDGELVWNTRKWIDSEQDFVAIGTDNREEDDVRRLIGGNIYGGCYSSGHINGNVKINIESDLLVRDNVFGDGNSYVELYDQGEDIMAVAMSVFGAGMGDKTEVWGSTEVNLKDAYSFQIYGGGEMGVVGKGKIQEENGLWKLDEDGYPIKSYTYSPLYSSTVNLRGTNAGYSENESGPVLAEAQYLYGAGNEGNVCGDSYLYLGNGRVYDVFGGASNADILGHVETYIGKQKTESGTFTNGFPWVQDIVFGGNDFGGMIGSGKTGDFSSDSRYRTTQSGMLNSVSTYVEYIQGRVDTLFGGGYGNYNYYDDIYNDYVYTYKDQAEDKLEGHKVGDPKNGFRYPYMYGNSFIFFQPVDNAKNYVGVMFGGSEGYPGHVDLNNTMQEVSYLLIDDINTSTANKNNYKNTDIFGGGAFGGMGTKDVSKNTYDVLKLLPGAGRTVIDLWAGRFNDVYGGCNKEGLIGFSRVNVPEESTIHVNSIFGGGKGYDLDQLTDDAEKDKYKALYCDHYITFVDFRGANAIVDNAIYGGNNNRRISFDTYVNIAAPVKNSQGQLTTVFGAGYGKETTSGRTNVFLQDGAQVNQIYGGGQNGTTYNYPSLVRWLYNEQSGNDPQAKLAGVMAYSSYLDLFHVYIEGKPEAYYPAHPINLTDDVLDIIDNVKEENGQKIYVDNGRTTVLEPENLLFNNTPYYNTNVHILEGAQVKGNPRAGGGTSNGYAYGGGLGQDAVIAGSTYIELKGGYVEKDIYAGGEGGTIMNRYRLHTQNGNQLFTASANVYVEGGTARNVYGGGYMGHVGYHEGEISNVAQNANDLAGESHVVIGKKDATSYIDGIPSITRNVYAGGEGGSVYGDAYLTIYNGYIGFNHGTKTETVIENEGTEDETSTTQTVDVYTENLDEYTTGDNRLDLNGNVFGGGYVASSYVDNSHIEMFGGTVRGSMYGGGELGPIGRGTRKSDAATPEGSKQVSDATIYKAGSTDVNLYSGHVMRNVFGGGRGKDSWGGEGWKPENETDLTAKGAVFGPTTVHIYGGEIGSVKDLQKTYGNVFGGGDEGIVFSTIGTKQADGYYYGSNDQLTEDCKVIITPYAVAKQNVTINGTDYAAGDYVPTADLNTMTNSDPIWQSLSDDGINIRNAVFAGGNTTVGSTNLVANEKTVFGNATASVTDVFSKDFITIGEDGIGGLYGDGNLTLVDGYRELNVTNYGTDYYNLNSSLTIDEYRKLNDRQRAYFELLYAPSETRVLSFYENQTTYMHTIDADHQELYKRGKKITAETWAALPNDEKGKWKEITNRRYTPDERGSRISQDEYESFWDEEKAYWDLYGFCTLYAGRMINTIQRADFCGVFGSRIVLKGAQDRVLETANNIDYTINRVGELSLNTVNKGQGTEHGNYFGIYNLVNYLGALTSDVDFNETRTTDNSDLATYGPEQEIDKEHSTENNTVFKYVGDDLTYYDWKQKHKDDRKRNNGSSRNELALASGVWLELLDEKTEKSDTKIYGPITGIVQLTLLNVAPGEGGGYVYAKNIHGVRGIGEQHVTLAESNANALSYKNYTYDEASVTEADKVESSGNFVNSFKRIIDDCYPQNDAYYVHDGIEIAPAHYWYIRGDYYVYDQYISAYTGSTHAYSENSNIPLTITAESQGRIKLQQVYENKYAYWDERNQSTFEKYQSKAENDAFVVGEITYHKNDPISWWAWSHLTTEQKELFTDKTYVCFYDVEYGDKEYKKGDVFDAPQPEIYICNENFTDGGEEYFKNDILTAKQFNALQSLKSKRKCSSVFNISNAVSSENGFLLTMDWSNPDVWNTYYHTIATTGSSQADMVKHSSEYSSIPDGYISSPSFYKNMDGTAVDGISVLGQQVYFMEDIIDQITYDKQNESITIGNETKHLSDYVNTDEQAQFKPVYIATATENFTAGGTSYVPKALISEDTYNSLSNAEKAYFDLGYLCNTTFNYKKNPKDSKPTYVVAGTVVPYGTDANDEGSYLYLVEKNASAAASLTRGYICTAEGKWGGYMFKGGNNYHALDLSNIANDERSDFKFNYDAFDLLRGDAYMTPTTMDQAYASAIYTEDKSIDYEATYMGNEDFVLDGGRTVAISRYNGTEYVPLAERQSTIKKGDIINNLDYEGVLINEQIKYSPIVITPSTSTDTVFYIVKVGMQIGDKYYMPGNQMTPDAYNALFGSSDQNNVMAIPYSDPSLHGSESKATDIEMYYFCTEAYGNMHLGDIIREGDYKTLKNEQRNFAINGTIPNEKSTLYVARDVDINSLSKDKILTAVYYYDYIESDGNGSSYEKIREYHVVNIHVHFESGIPIIGELMKPNIVLPGDHVALNQPTVTKGAYDIIGGGWEIYSNPTNASEHRNGTEFENSNMPLYWYQNGYWVAYYALSYLGKTYSNPVELSVANYHDIKKVMDDQANHYYINKVVNDKNNNRLKPKVYIDDYSLSSQNGLDLFKDFYDLSLRDDYSTIQAGSNVEFFLRTNLDHSGSAWESIGTGSDPCFEGTLHGDGYTISGLSSSLFDKLCGKVYNLGVTGSFNGSGIAETGGEAVNCWVMTTTDQDLSGKNAVLGTGIVTNSYYPQSNAYSSLSSATAMPDKSFYNGEVAYNLNSFYLDKRYYNGIQNDTEIQYVKSRYADGDYRYAGGFIPQDVDVRESSYVDQHTQTTVYVYTPVFPDDYIYFGQALTYGWNDDKQHQDVPSHFDGTNRVYRAPAYYGSANMSSVHFNQNAVLSATAKNNSSLKANPGLTAVDFTGYADVTGSNSDYKRGKQTVNGVEKYYAPVLDFDGLTGIRTDGQTKNLLVYVKESDTDTKTVVETYFKEPDYFKYAKTQASGYTVDNDYFNVLPVSDLDLQGLHGHMVVENNYGDYITTGDHFLVDREDFNAPIEYTMGDNQVMWYQRKPSVFVQNAGTGWESISLPFTTQIVTTNEKGWITHFYEGSKTGHEYWLRTPGEIETTTEQNQTISKLLFKSLSKATATDISNGRGANLNYLNTFLWDHYYSHNGRKDKNGDEYQQYYSTNIEHNNYPFALAANPYLIGFPGSKYYEFDMSGEFDAKNTWPSTPVKIGAQTITFVSADGITIYKSDDDYNTQTDVENGSYLFKPTYQTKQLNGQTTWLLDGTGSKFENNTTQDVTTVPFRAYLAKSTAQLAPIRSGSTKAAAPTAIYIGYAGDQMPLDDIMTDRGLLIYSEDMNICVESTLTEPAQVNVTTVSGKSLGKFTIQPGTKLTIPVSSRGVYIVNHHKIAVTK